MVEVKAGLMSQRSVFLVTLNKAKRIRNLHDRSLYGGICNCLLQSAKNIAYSSLEYHQDTEAHMPITPLNSVIVKDDGFYNSRELSRVPGFLSTQADIQNLLLPNDIFIEETYRKTTS